MSPGNFKVHLLIASALRLKYVCGNFDHVHLSADWLSNASEIRVASNKGYHFSKNLIKVYFVLGVKQYGSSPYCILPSSVLQYIAILQYMTRRC